MKKLIWGMILVIGALTGCSSEEQGEKNYHRGIYLLLDTSGTYTQELKKAQQIINYNWLPRRVCSLAPLPAPTWLRPSSCFKEKKPDRASRSS